MDRRIDRICQEQNDKNYDQGRPNYTISMKSQDF